MSTPQPSNLNISNAFSVSRIVFAVPVCYFVLHGRNDLAALLGFFAGTTDFFDGYFARKLNQVTELGKMLDPLADKIFIGALVICLMTRGILPLWFVATVIARDLVIFGAGMYLKASRGIVLMSNKAGKLAVCILSLLMFGVLLTDHWIENPIVNVLMWSSLFVLAVSFVMYAIRGVQELSKGRA